MRPSPSLHRPSLLHPLFANPPATIMLQRRVPILLQVSCFNDMCGDYFDMLHVRVGDQPSKDIPVRVGVAGTPLVVQKERVLVKGLGGRAWRTDLDFGELPQVCQLRELTMPQLSYAAAI